VLQILLLLFSFSIQGKKMTSPATYHFKDQRVAWFDPEALTDLLLERLNDLR
jgi:hypothetical protein